MTFSKLAFGWICFNPNEMLCKISDGQTIFKGSPMLLLTPLGKDGLPIEVLQAVYMIAFIDIQVLVAAATVACHFANNG